MARKSGRDTVIERRRRWDEHKPAFEDHWRIIKWARKFSIDLEHYSSEDLRDLKESNRIAPITLDQYDAIRFIASELSNSELYLDVDYAVPEELMAERPKYDPALNDYVAPEAKPKRDLRWAKWALERDLMGSECGYQRVRDSVALDGIAARAGWAILEWDPTQGRRGRIFARIRNAEHCLWHSSYRHPQDPGQPFFSFREALDLEWVQNCSGWDNVDKLIPDGASEIVEDITKLSPEQRIVTIQHDYDLYDTTTKRTLEPTHEPEKLPEGERYMACEDCDWEMPANGMKLPKVMRCQQCGGTARRIDYSGNLIPTPAYKKGKRYTVTAPNCADAGVLRDGGWPGDPGPYPLMYFVPNPHPQDISGPCYTETTRDYQCELDSMFRLGHEYMQRSHDWLFVEMGRFVDAQREPFQFDGASDWVGFTESPEALNSARHIQGSQLPPTVQAWWNQVAQSFRQNRGIGQLGVAPEELKGMQVGTTQRFMESGDVPQQAVLARFQGDETYLVQAWHDMQRNLYTLPDWLSIAGPDGEKGFHAVRGEDLPEARITVRAKPSVKASEMDKFEKLTQILSNPALTPATLKIAGQAAGVPEDWIRDVAKERWGGLQQGAAAANAGMPGAPGSGMPAPGAGQGTAPPPANGAMNGTPAGAFGPPVMVPG